MAKIHWLVYIIVGLFVSIASYKLNFQKLIFFFYIGMVFVVVGIAKLIFNSTAKRAGKAQNVQHKSQHQARFRYCQKCSSILRPHDRFCSRCGSRI